MAPIARQVHLASSDWNCVLEASTVRASYPADSFDAIERLPGLTPELAAAIRSVREMSIGMLFKPEGGFWTSSELASKEGSAWEAFAGRVGLGPSNPAAFVFEVVGAPRILEIADEDDVLAGMRAIGLPGHRSIEGFARFWSQAPEAWDAVRVPHHHRHAGLLNMWDVESTVWFRPDRHLALVARREVLARHQRRGRSHAAG